MADADWEWREEVKRRAGWRCEARELVPEVECLGGLEADHVRPKGKYPELRHDLENGQALCVAHHKWKHDHHSEAKARGLAKAAVT